MRRDELNKNDMVLTRYQYKAKIVGFTDRLIVVFNGKKRIKLHHSDIIENYGGREHEKRI